MSTIARSFRVIALCVPLTLVAAVPAVSGTVEVRYDFAEPIAEQRGGYTSVTMDGAWSYGAPSEPSLPMWPVRILLPPGEAAVDIDVRPGEKVVVGSGYLVEPGQWQYPLSYDGPVARVEPNYGARASFPGRLVDEPKTGFLRGHSIASLALHPVEYEPSTGTLSYYKHIDVVVTTSPTARAEAARAMGRSDAATARRVSAAVDNPEARTRYSGFEQHGVTSPLLPPEPAYDYVIITTDAWDEYLDDFVDLKTKRGFRTGVFLKSWILERYAGVDEQQSIRRFIIDAYRTWGTEYVLLVGDTRDENGIPHRGLYAIADGGSTDGTRPEVDTDIPGDIYYAALDGTWNDDGDGWWGEPGEADLYPDIAVVRICVNEYWEIANFTDKVRYYEEDPVVSECDEALMVGEYLWPDTYGGDSKDEIRNGSSEHGYTTAGFPDRMNVETLYERDVGDWDPSAVIFLMENGVNIVNHLGHCNLHHVMKLSPIDISTFTNDGSEHTLNFIYTQGCYSGAFDNKVIGGGYTYDCFLELMTVAQVGAAACVGNSRYGWGDLGGTNGSSQYFDREFFDAMFGEGIYELGRANNDSKADVVWAIDYGSNRWCSYQLNLFGDPSIQLWTGEPATLTVDRPSLILTDTESVSVQVRGPLSEPVEGARVVAYTDDGSVYGHAYTDASGAASVQASAPVSGTLHLKVIAHDYIDHESDVPIVSATEPYLDFVAQSVDDDSYGDSHGNGDGSVNAGETVEVLVSLENLGGGEALSPVASLSCDSEHVTVVEGESPFGDIASGATAQPLSPFVIELAPDTPDGEMLDLLVEVTAPGRGSWSHEFELPVSAPVLSYVSRQLDDSGGNGNGCPEAGESVTIELVLSNTGGVRATGVTVTVSSDDPYVTIDSGVLSGMTLESGETAVLDGEYAIEVLPSCPFSHPVHFDLTIEADWGYIAEGEMIILTAGESFFDDIEDETTAWYHEAVTDGSEDAWHVTSSDGYSGETCWKFGDEGEGTYPSSSDGALFLDPVCVSSGGELRFWDKLDAESESSTTAWDCALVEVSTDFGGTWAPLEPVGGYTHTKSPSTTNPLPDGTPCWSGAHDWREESFDLSSLVGESAMFRFRFVSDDVFEQEGWHVDDVAISFPASVDGGQDADAARETPAVFALRQNTPNPFNPVTAVSYELPSERDVRIDVYNIAGRLVKTLVDRRVDAGYHRAVWDGTDERGRRVASGVYMYRMKAGGFVDRKVMVLLK